jgi:hypothetical protein
MIAGTPSNSMKHLENNSPIDDFFRSYQGFQYDPSVIPSEAYRQLRAFGNWRRDDEEGEDAWVRYRSALVREFNRWYGRDETIEGWHSLCRAVRVSPLPLTIANCRQVSS